MSEEEYEWCLACGKTDWEDYNDDTEHNRSNGGIIHAGNGFEVFICSFCRFFIEGE